MARRRNSIAHRFAKIRGLPPEEKALMQRIANLIDGALNNRQASNPFEQSQQRTNRQIYPPTGILIKQGVKSVKIIWDAPPSNELLRYEITFDNLTTGTRTIKSSFTSEVIFKATAGTYIAKIVSVGRDGATSPVKQIQFEVGEDVMQIEGKKNGPLELGTRVQDNILLIAGYSVYVWGSTVLDKYMAASSNEEITLRLWRAEKADAVVGVDPFTIQETIVLYPSTESASNLDATARAGLITRPSGNRVGSFETSQSVMFSPLSVAAIDDNKTVTYLLQAIGREVEQDEVCLSLVMWAGADGASTSIPGDPFTPDPGYVFPNLNCFHTQKVGLHTINLVANTPWDTRSLFADVDREHQLIGNQWTIAMWLRFDDLNVRRLAGDPTSNEPDNPNGGPINILTRGAINPATFPTDENRNAITIVASGSISGGTDQHALTIQVNNRNTDEFPVGGPFVNARSVSYIANVTGGPDEDESSGLFTWGDASNTNGAQNDAWYFLVVCFSGGDFTGGIPKIRTYMNSVTAPLSTKRSSAGVTPYMAQLVPSGADTTLEEVMQDDNHHMGYNLSHAKTTVKNANYFVGHYTGNLRYGNINNFQIQQLGMWNVCLDAVNEGQGASIGSIQTIFNEGHGTEIDWRKNIITTNLVGTLDTSKSYWQSENLIHLIQFGAVERDLRDGDGGFAARDTGNHLFRGDMNMTGTSIRYISSQTINWLPGTKSPNDMGLTNTGEHFTDNTTIADFLSPDGANGTTQFDQCYPGQNLTGGSG